MVAIEKTQPALEGKSYPACVAGARNCPPEDCGGSWGYQHLLEVLADPAHPEHAEQIEWIREEFDPNKFAVEIADAMLAARFNRKQNPAVHQSPRPFRQTQHSEQLHLYARHQNVSLDLNRHQ